MGYHKEPPEFKNEYVSKNATIEDMPNDDMTLVAQECGMEVAIKLLKNCKGMVLNVPKFGFKNLIDRYIKENYKPGLANRIALKCGCSQRYVYEVMEIDPEEEKRQARLWDETEEREKFNPLERKVI